MNQVCGHACAKKRRQMGSSTATDLIHGAYLGSYIFFDIRNFLLIRPEKPLCLVILINPRPINA